MSCRTGTFRLMREGAAVGKARYHLRMRSVRVILVGVAVLAVAFPAAARSSRLPVARFQGFRSLPDGSEVFVQLDRSPGQPIVRKAKGGIELVLPSTRAARRFRALDARYFPTPVRTVETKRKGRDLIVHISLKEQVEPQLDVREDKGVFTVALRFPPGTPETAPPPNPLRRSSGTAAPAAVAPPEDQPPADGP